MHRTCWGYVAWERGESKFPIVGGCQIVDIKNDAPTPFAHINPQNFGDLVKLAREYPERKLIWCEDGYFAPYVD